MFLENFLQVFKISPRFLKVHIFGSIFSLQLSLRLKTVVDSIKTLKSYCKATFNVFLNKNIFDDDKFFLFVHQIFCIKSKFYYLTCKNYLKFQVFPDFIA